MKKSTKIWLITAASLILLGLIIFGGVMTVLDWDFTKLSTDNYETNTYDINESFSDISIGTITADVEFVLSDSDICSIVCYEQEKIKHSVSVKDGTLFVEAVDERAWYNHIGIQFNMPKITVYLPKGDYGKLCIRNTTGGVTVPSGYRFAEIDVSTTTGSVSCRADALCDIKIKATTGSIAVSELSARSLSLSVTTGQVNASKLQCEGALTVKTSTGDITLQSVACGSVTSTGSTGDTLLKNVVATEAMRLERSTGDIVLERSDAAEISIKTDTGDVTGSILTNKVFHAHSDTGSVKVPKLYDGGKCEIETDTGNIRIEIAEKK